MDDSSMESPPLQIWQWIFEARMVDARRHTINEVVIGSIVVVTRNEEEIVDGSQRMDVGNAVDSQELSGNDIGDVVVIV